MKKAADTRGLFSALPMEEPRIMIQQVMNKIFLRGLVGVCLIFLSAVGVATAQTSRTIDDPESYAVYGAVIASDWPLRIAKAKRLVMMVDTELYPGEAVMASCLKPEPDHKAELEPLLLAYREVNKSPWRLQRKFDISVPYEFVTKESMKSVLEFVYNVDLNPWEDFYKKYPDSGGVISMSAVGFSADKKLALVYMGHLCGSLCGGGRYHLLEKKQGKWTKIYWPGDSCSWVS